MSAQDLARILPPNAQVHGGRLVIGGCDTVELAERFGTPLYVYDEEALQRTCEDLAGAMASGPSGSRGLFALKAFPSVAMARIAGSAGLGVLCASSGEAAVARAAGVPWEDLVLHGNNKSEEELRTPVGRLVVDSFDEIDRLERLRVRGDVWLRVAPGIEAGAFEAIRTGGTDSKFGIGLSQLGEAMQQLSGLDGIRVVGLHAHVGSQVFDPGPYAAVAPLLVGLADEVAAATGVAIREVGLGGGFGVAYTHADPVAPSPAEMAAAILHTWPDRRALVLEPGRSLVARAAVTLHTIGTVKRIPGVRTYVAIDGGMSDNIRPPLYGARYEFLLAGRAEEPASQEVRIVGKHCESGDVVAPEALLPADARPGEILVTAVTGAYTWAMASTYNQIPRAAVVMCRDGKVREVVRRETVMDLLRLQDFG